MFAYPIIAAVLAASAYAYYHGAVAEAEYVTSEVDGRAYLVQKGPGASEAADALGKINRDLAALVQHLAAKFPDDARGARIAERFDPSAVSEGSATSGYTSYSVNKGERIVLCLRQDDAARSFAPPNVVMYVALHELAHLGTEQIGHPPAFWECFKFLLEQAIAIGVYVREDYAKRPQRYCGIVIDSSVV